VNPASNRDILPQRPQKTQGILIGPHIDTLGVTGSSPVAPIFTSPRPSSSYTPSDGRKCGTKSLEEFGSLPNSERSAAWLTARRVNFPATASTNNPVRPSSRFPPGATPDTGTFTSAPSTPRRANANTPAFSTSGSLAGNWHRPPRPVGAPLT